MQKLLRFTLIVSMLLNIIVSVRPSSVVQAQAPQLCHVSAYDGWYDQTVPPAPANLDLDGDGIVTRGDWMICSQMAIDYFNYCGITTIDEADAGICHHDDGTSNSQEDNQPNANPSNDNASNTPTEEAPITVPSLMATDNLYVRSGPGPSCPQIGMIRPGTWYTIAATNVGNSWLQIAYNGSSGWVSANYVNINDPAQLSTTPTLAGSNCTSSAETQPEASNRPILTVISVTSVTTAPDATCDPIGTIAIGDRYIVEGKNSDSSWLQIIFNDQPGWVEADDVTLDDPSLMFVVPQSDAISTCLPLTLEDGNVSENSAMLQLPPPVLQGVPSLTIGAGTTEISVIGLTVASNGLNGYILSSQDAVCLPNSVLQFTDQQLQQWQNWADIACTLVGGTTTLIGIMANGVTLSTGAGAVAFLLPILAHPERYTINNINDAFDNNLLSCTFARYVLNIDPSELAICPEYRLGR